MNPLKALAIVEDDAVLREELSCFFVNQGYLVHEANSHQGLLDILKLHDIQVVVLDLNLPGKNGYEIASWLKHDLPRLGVVIMTARTSLTDRIKGYEVGADIYLPKPTNPMELLAAVRNLAKRLQDTAPQTQKFQLSMQARRMTSLETCCDDLTGIEVFLLRVLAMSPDKTVDIGEMLNALEEKFIARTITRRALENIFSRLRKKLTTAFDNDLDPIKAVRGFGYQLTWSIEIVD